MRGENSPLFLFEEPMKKQNGFSLLEMMIVCLVITILISIAVPTPAAVAAMMASRDAKEKVKTVALAVSTQNICNANHVTCNGIAPLIPSNGDVTTSAYRFHMDGNTQNQYTYSATPFNATRPAFFVDNTSIMRCATGQADSNSPLCQ
jgi:prepilin-type N-terminal cleavage/methylation domain-containing protein